MPGGCEWNAEDPLLCSGCDSAVYFGYQAGKPRHMLSVAHRSSCHGVQAIFGCRRGNSIGVVFGDNTDMTWSLATSSQSTPIDNYETIMRNNYETIFSRASVVAEKKGPTFGTGFERLKKMEKRLEETARAC